MIRTRKNYPDVVKLLFPLTLFVTSFISVTESLFCYNGDNNNFTLDHDTQIGSGYSAPLTWIEDKDAEGLRHLKIRTGLRRVECPGAGYVCVKGTYHNATMDGKKTQVAKYGCAVEKWLKVNSVVEQYCPPGHENKFLIQDCLLFTCGRSWCNTGSVATVGWKLMCVLLVFLLFPSSKLAYARILYTIGDYSC